MIDFDGLGPVGGAPEREVDPIKLFQGLQVTDPGINDLWLAQGDALREWHAKRASDDLAIVLNTGAGKTLVGLVAAQSLVNETQRQVVYACASIQLIEQTAAKARGYGLDVTTYFRGGFNNDLYQRALAPCLTTYQALFNGKSRFRNDDIGAVVFDDAHAASGIIRDQFTLAIKQAEFPGLFDELVALYRPYMASVHKDVQYDEAVQGGDPRTSWFIPPFAHRAVLEGVKTALMGAQLGESLSTMFVWEYLSDSLDLCAVFMSGTQATFTPPIVPIRNEQCMQAGVRRVYLSATLAAGDAFLRTFGRVPSEVIAPRTTAGECERMILFPLHFQERGGEADESLAKRMIEGKKALIVTPSRYQGAKWDDVVTADLGEDVGQQVETFKRAAPPACLRLIARYDGVDLPGDTCRMMIIDGVPSGMGPLERFMWERLKIQKVLRSSVASRVVQSFGRISRGMSDFGSVVVVGQSLVNWLVTPANQASLPSYLGSQILVGLDLSKGITADVGVVAPDLCFSRDEGWVRHHADNVRASMELPLPETDEEALEGARVEVDAGHYLWARDHVRAARVIADGRAAAFKFSSSFGGWLVLWQGYAVELAGDLEGARTLYAQARRACSAIPPFPVEREGGDAYSAQVENVASMLSGPAGANALARYDADVAALAGNMSVAKTEEAVRCLGSYLGLDSSRPEKETGTGPDDLWGLPGESFWAMELKTEKEGALYWKSDVMQLHDHVRWTSENSDASAIVPVFVGPRLPADARANPEPETLVVELSSLSDLAATVRAALQDIVSEALPITLLAVVNRVLNERGLTWETVSSNGIPRALLSDL